MKTTTKKRKGIFGKIVAVAAAGATIGLATYMFLKSDRPIDKNEKFIKNDVPAKEIWSYYLAYIPWIASLITPITVFITTVLE